MYQNIIKYGQSQNSNNKEIPGVFLLNKEYDTIYLTAGNYIQKFKTKELLTQIDFVNNKTIKELEALYRETIYKKTSDKNAAGLGLIDMRLKSEQKLDYGFYDQEGDLSVFIIRVSVKIK